MDADFSLVMETSTPHASIARVGPQGLVEQRAFCSDRHHNAMLFEPLEQLFHRHGRQDIGLVLVGSGPGSYSGTRVGIAAAQGVAIALACPAVAVPSILAVPSAAGGAACLAIGDARRGSYWSARVENLRLLDGPVLCDVHGLVALVEAALAVGVRVFSFEDVVRFQLPDELAARVSLETPDAARLWQAWQSADEATQRQWASAIPQPLYLKPPHITPAKRPLWERPPAP
ncbi:MAG: tRNA ((37)-N6)-threonylcarbamoyltransferase complex dimerization subunit type 1 TsaB [Verrucomicrobiota bacterium]|jgi:tRNA threonylcarbamoyl adenosine modification protein YeaZ